MKQYLKICTLLLTAAAWSLTGCSTDDLSAGDIENGSNPESGRVVYINAGIALPSAGGSRSGTDDTKPDGGNNDKTNSDSDKDGTQNDYEYGYDYENDVRTMILVIADTNDNYLAHSVIQNIDAEPTTSQKFDFTVDGEIQYDDLEAAYDSVLNDNQTVRIYVYCNYTGRLLNYFSTTEKTALRGKNDWINETGEVVEAASPANQTPAISNTIWAPRSFLMTNSKVYEFTFPAKIEDWDPYADKNNPYKLVENDTVEKNAGTGSGSDGYNYDDIVLTPIQVERAAARLDFKDGSGNNNTYELKIDPAKDIPNPEGLEGGSEGDATTPKGEKNLFSIQLTRMSLVNMSKNFYYFRRVSNADDGYSTPQIGKPETNKNYVVDTDASTKASHYTATTARNAFNFPLYTEASTDEAPAYDRGMWFTDNISTVLNNGKNDTWSVSNGSYNIWRYVTENTIPGAQNQITVQSTGIVFKGAIIAGEHIKDGFDADYDETENLPEEPYVSAKVQEALAEASNHTPGKTDQNSNGYDYPILYSYNNMLYGDIDELVIAAALDGHNGSLYMAVSNILENWKLKDDEFEFNTSGTGAALTVDTYYAHLTYESTYAKKLATALAKQKEIEPDLDEDEFTTQFKAEFDITYAAQYPNYDKEVASWGDSEGNFDNQFMKLAPGNNITIYKASDETDGEGWGYYCYYFYWNRHNDNGKSGEMGPMEFATVRNNVYKLAVTKIGALGHPRITDFDPDPEKPGDPDEPRMRYIQVQVEVLPWVVRVNDIEF